MCIPHAPNNTFKADKRERKSKAKESTPFDKKLLEPDPDFIDERKDTYSPQDKTSTLLDKLFSFMH